MNKAAFLDILHHVSAISDKEVLELEKVVESFPYCQTAHLLLAKAAYDKGSMLSNQKLRKAAVSAVNRQLLKKLIYTASPAVTLDPVTSEITIEEPLQVDEPVDLIPKQNSATEEILLPSPLNQEISNFTKEEPEYTVEGVEETDAIVVLPFESEITEPYSIGEEIENSIPLDDIEESSLKEENEIVFTEEEIIIETIPEGIPITSELVEEPDLNPEAVIADNIDLAAIAEIMEDYDALFSVDYLPTALPARDTVTDFINALAEETGTIILAEENQIDSKFPDLELKDSASQENIHQLNEDVVSKPETPVNDNTVEAFDKYLFTPEEELSPVSAPSYQEEIIYKVFEANDLGYWMDSSRLGETLMVKSDLVAAKPFHFQPELLLEYSKQHGLEKYERPPESVLVRQLDIIDQFLKLNPKLKSMAQLKIKQEPMEDLSSKSTKIKKNLASETFATILVQQGKIKKAIKIYEHLILKLPEKKAYFASQIEKLQNIS